MYAREVRLAARSLAVEGRSKRNIARELGVSRAAVRDWLRGPEAAGSRRSTCFVCGDRSCPEPETYAYVLGAYLGDGYLVTSTRVPRLRVACADAYPQIAAEVDDAMTRLSGNVTGSVQSIGCSDHYNYWMHWPCLLPQHGPGRKHERPIVLAGWQRMLVAEHPWPLIRGLIHSDGCRTTNRVVVRGARYEYPRYFFSNQSSDILQIMGDALDRVGVAWRYNRGNSISIARRAAVAMMDVHVGPKT